MTTKQSIPLQHGIHFKGEGTKYFSIVFVNYLLMIVTLGLYYPWAKCSKLKYLYENTEFGGSPFSFLGTGKELFKGFLKLVVILVVLISIYEYLTYSENAILAIIIVYSAIFFLVPLALHGSYRYRLSRTTWRGIHFGYRGDLKELFSKWVIGILLTIFTIGIYGPWFAVNIRKYMIENIRFGSVKFHYKGEGIDLFLIHLKGFFFSIFTLGIYSFWYTKNLYNFYVNNLVLEHKNGEYHNFHSQMTGGDFFELNIVNLLIIVFTLGIGYPFVEIRTFKYLVRKMTIDCSFDPDSIVQTEENYNDATAEDLASWLDIDLV